MKNHYYEWYDTCATDTAGGGIEIMTMSAIIGPPPGGGIPNDTCFYDNRIKTQYLRSFNKTLMEVPPYGMSGNSYRYIYAGDDRIAMKEMFDNEETFYYLKDHLGTTRILLDESAIPRDYYYDYRAFGKLESSSVNEDQKYRYTGKPYDDDGGINLYYYGARYYDAKIGRFLTIDPLHGRYPSLSPYVYCANNPMKYYDPNGAEYYESIWVPGLSKTRIVLGKSYAIMTRQEKFKVHWRTLKNDWVEGLAKQIPWAGAFVGLNKIERGGLGATINSGMINFTGASVGNLGRFGLYVSRIGRFWSALNDYLGMDSPEVIAEYNRLYGEEYIWDNIEGASSAIDKIIADLERSKEHNELNYNMDKSRMCHDLGQNDPSQTGAMMRATSRNSPVKQASSPSED